MTVLKAYFKKQKPKIIKYRNYKNFCNEAFKQELVKELNDNNILPGQLESFENVVFKILQKHAPQKLKYIRNNQAPFMTKKLQKEMMTRSRTFK